MRGYKIHLIRHGLAEGAEEGKYIGSSDVSLTQYGRKQLKDMMSQYEYPEAEIVISSPLNRCLETAKMLYPDKNPVIFDDLSEYDFGEFEGMTAEELSGDSMFAEWIKGGEDAKAPFGESNGEFRDRVCKSFYNIVQGILKTEPRSVAIISHGGVIMTIMQYFAFPEKPMHEWVMPNGCGYTLNVDRRVWENFGKAEAFAEIPFKEFEYDENEPYNEEWDGEIDPEEFKGFYTPSEDR